MNEIHIKATTPFWPRPISRLCHLAPGEVSASVLTTSRSVAAGLLQSETLVSFYLPLSMYSRRSPHSRLAKHSSAMNSWNPYLRRISEMKPKPLASWCPLTGAAGFGKCALGTFAPPHMVGTLNSLQGAEATAARRNPALTNNSGWLVQLCSNFDQHCRSSLSHRSGTRSA